MAKTRHHHTPDQEPITCQWQGCEEEGTHPAPFAPDQLRTYRWFCLHHVREYNKGWNYFDTMAPEEAEHYQLNSVYGHRPTWKMGVEADIRNTQQLEQALHHFLDDDEYTPEPVNLPDNMKKALQQLQLSWPVTLEEVKKQYKMLVKRYHPDVNHNCKHAEEQCKTISIAYRLLCDSALLTA